MPPAPLVANDSSSSRNNIDDFCCENENLCARPSELLLSESYAAVMRLNAERSIRISALQSTFPLSQYLILVAIGSSICLAFLIETNQEIIIFLNALQLRILWTMLIGLMSTLSVLCYDLSDPFRGIFTIESALKQLYTIRDALRVSSKYEDTFWISNSIGTCCLILMMALLRIRCGGDDGRGRNKGKRNFWATFSYLSSFLENHLIFGQSKALDFVVTIQKWRSSFFFGF